MTNAMTSNEGARAFANIFTELEDGALHSEISAQLQALNEKLAQHAEAYGRASGTLTITVRLSAERGGPVAIEADYAVKAPKATRLRTIMWLTPGANLTPRNPRQTVLPLHEVPVAQAPARDLPAERSPRSV